MNREINEESHHRYIETNPGKAPLVLLHGLFGDLSNFSGIIDGLGEDYNVVLPLLPIFEMPIKTVSVRGFSSYIKDFVEYKKLTGFHLLGNSLGGHIAQVFTLDNPHLVKTIILTGSSGLFEHSFGTSFVKRNDYEFIKNKTASTFYDPAIATKEMVDTVYESVNDRNKALRLLFTAKSAIRENLEDKLHTIKQATCLIWGKQDEITPPFVAEKFKSLISTSELHFIDKCGHAPMMEQPDQFNVILKRFLQQNS